MRIHYGSYNNNYGGRVENLTPCFIYLVLSALPLYRLVHFYIDNEYFV